MSAKSSVDIQALVRAIRKAGRVWLCGNGGSAANALHIANDLMAAGIRAQAMLEIATLTAIANDHGYDQVFARQVALLAEPGDLLICLSGSGNSPNILAAIRAAKDKGVDVVVITMGGRAAAMADSIITPQNMQASEGTQLWIGHELAQRLQEWKGCEKKN